MKKAIVLLSGGLDSATCLAVASDQGLDCYALSFDYGQKNKAELLSAKKLSAQFGVVEHKIITLSIGELGGSALTDAALDVPDYVGDQFIPITYVPARNTIFLSIALGWAEITEADVIFIGANAVDYSGYPDCRPEYIAAFQQMANLATKRGLSGHPIHIETPLIQLSKSDIITLGNKLGVDYALTVSCYRATRDGLACGHCDSCTFRKKGFAEANLKDVTRYV
ncbi:MAG: 7-cyano-7-deazaguanine synthase QueC [Gammaproteobacteria bacterium CG_4_10_14_0_8_um_filter_38_16]|nr:MAG: 7-cyano-7-deazaguanine synthase QueC [Gammaproteobacteria bacterium CG_4_10_14_0_8_um_filter_38_16]PJA03773.1 MAG: 7-cyano-7-deazaguanine synthase QueC [Gammaproteobacteria bacterium CG_4_10_14_0_2_um_filter_38_22]PJB10384.1 MAG: 7-cyano-7-deazaguanine synthase QueC [Gammaproteobacteria bacterium CG_4_9_14_3_um_filter_38_9]